MIKTVIHTQKYFQAPDNYFWRWGEQGALVEWYHGITICYRDDLLQLLSAVSDKGLPPMGSLLLLLAACRNSFNIHDKVLLLRGLESYDKEKTEVYKLIDKAMVFSSIVHALPETLRTGFARVHLIREVFADTGFVFSNHQVKAAIAEMSSGRLDELVFTPGDRYTAEQVKTDLRYFAEAIDRFPDVTTLENKLRTGFTTMPSPVPMELPDSTSVNILDELAADNRTLGLARLTRRLTAALIIPLHSQKSGDHSFGGITDITNRGNYDKLLLSELAHDTDLLMARLVNNEALYFKREEPPDNPKRKRILLIDSTLKLWGVPRVFALSAALAIAQNVKHGEATEAYMLGGEDYHQIGLSTKATIMEALGYLHHALHCGKALQKAMKELGGKEDTELVLITRQGNMQHPAFFAFYTTVRKQLQFLVLVDRSGELSFTQLKKGTGKILTTAKLDLNDLLFPSANKVIQAEKLNTDQPAFLLRSPPPLLFPRIRISFSSDKYLHDELWGTIVVTVNNRLLYIRSKDRGADEILANIEIGQYYFAWGELERLFVLIHQGHKNLIIIYAIETDNHLVKRGEISLERVVIKEVALNNGKFYLETDKASYAIICESFEIIEKRTPGSFEPVFSFQRGLKKNITSGVGLWDNQRQQFNILFKFKEVGISQDGQLVLGKYMISLCDWAKGKEIMIIDKPNNINIVKRAQNSGQNRKIHSNKKVKLVEWHWKDGSRAVIDSRGLLHLRSADSTIPEVTLVLILAASVAGWASDGNKTGNPYFFRDDTTNYVRNEFFYEKYLHSFIQRILMF
ncbi:MAG: hypothetical protein NTW29_06850 [Bacteroidetes bacterium]|nr:hypothetical protein [Bacteroidota bacterium]